MTSRAGRILTSPITAVCLVVFLADVATGMVAPTFSLFAQSLGISLALLGIINTFGGLSQLVSSFPLGALSDRFSRLWLIRGGTLAFALATVLLAVAQGSANLLLARILLAVGGFAVFRVAGAHLGDITTRGQRSLAFGIFATSLGLGFTVGSFSGGQLAGLFSPRVTFWIATAVALLAFFLAWKLMHDPRSGERAVSRPVPLLDAIRQVAGMPAIVFASLGSLLVSIAFSGAITTFFPIYAKDDAFISQAAIGTMFAIRGLVSTVGRAPNGVLARHFGNMPLMLGSLAVLALVMFGFWTTTNQIALTVLLAIEGLTFGAFLVGNNAFIADNTEPENRGAATGMETTASGVGATVAPLVLGLVASYWGVAAVFPVTGSILGIGFIIAVGLSINLLRAEHSQPDTTISVVDIE